MKASKKNARKLAARQKDWEEIKESTMIDSHTKNVSGAAYHKPGSQSK